MLGRRIAARPRPPATVRDLEIALLEEWKSIPQSLIDNLIASMANRREKCVRSNYDEFQSVRSDRKMSCARSDYEMLCVRSNHDCCSQATELRASLFVCISRNDI
ncbi:hypothetical protein TNCV_3447171 [Trichonephila clavipes]|nr:hypothetical protein TNCV_3447171 [Trichonephila clavipes]